MNTINLSNLTDCQNELGFFLAHPPGAGRAGTRPWCDGQGRLLASERQARLELLERYTPTVVANFCAKHGVTVADVVDASAHQDRQAFFADNFYAELAQFMAPAGAPVTTPARTGNAEQARQAQRQQLAAEVNALSRTLSEMTQRKLKDARK